MSIFQPVQTDRVKFAQIVKWVKKWGFYLVGMWVFYVFGEIFGVVVFLWFLGVWHVHDQDEERIAALEYRVAEMDSDFREILHIVRHRSFLDEEDQILEMGKDSNSPPKSQQG